MPITLSTAFSPGHNHPGVSYPHCQIMSFHHNSIGKYIALDVQWGTEASDGRWQRGDGTIDKSFTIDGDAYAAIVASMPQSGTEPLYAGVKRTLYAWLIANHPEVCAGVVA